MNASIEIFSLAVGHLVKQRDAAPLKMFAKRADRKSPDGGQKALLTQLGHSGRRMVPRAPLGAVIMACMV
jgi:hypothetical protein